MTRITFTDATGETVLIMEYLHRDRLTRRMFKSIYYNVSDPYLPEAGYQFPINICIQTPYSTLNLAVQFVYYYSEIYCHIYRLPQVPNHSTVLFRRMIR